MIVKTDSSGDTCWTKTIIEEDVGTAIYAKQISDSEILIGGYSYSDPSDYRKLWLIKTNLSGEIRWKKILNIDSTYNLSRIIQTSDKGFLFLTSLYTEENNLDIRLIKTDSLGNKLWLKKYGSTNYDTGISITQTYDSGYIISGSTNSYGQGDSDAWLIKTNFDGDTIWTKRYGTNNNEYFNEISETADHGCIVTGNLTGYEEDFGLVKINSTGDTLWTRNFLLCSNILEYPTVEAVRQTNDGGYLILGNFFIEFGTYKCAWLMKTNSEGDSSWIQILDFDPLICVHSMQLLNENDLIIAGSVKLSGSEGRDILLIKMSDHLNNIVSKKSNFPSSFILYQNYPNPFNPSTIIKFNLSKTSYVTMEVYNTLGQKVTTLLKKYMNSGTHTVKFNALNLPSGIYYYKINAGKYNSIKKMLLLH